MPDEDKDLMFRAQRGEAQAFGTVVNRYASPLLGFVLGLVRDRHAAEEVVQDAFLQVWKTRLQFDPTRPFKPWLYRIAINRCHELARKQQEASPTPPTSEPETPDSSPIASLLAAEQDEQVRFAVGRLPFTQRAVVMLRVWDGMTYSEIAELLTLPEGTARSHMHHALNALREELAALMLE